MVLPDDFLAADPLTVGDFPGYGRGLDRAFALRLIPVSQAHQSRFLLRPLRGWRRHREPHGGSRAFGSGLAFDRRVLGLLVRRLNWRLSDVLSQRLEVRLGRRSAASGSGMPTVRAILLWCATGALPHAEVRARGVEKCIFELDSLNVVG